MAPWRCYRLFLLGVKVPLKVDYGSLPPQVLALITPVRLGLGLLDPKASMDIRAQIRSRVARDSKFSKFQALYFLISPVLPLAWFYDCAECAFYQRKGRTCEVVQGDISPYAWCGLWTNLQEDRPFSWVGRAIGA